MVMCYIHSRLCIDYDKYAERNRLGIHNDKFPWDSKNFELYVRREKEK